MAGLEKKGEVETTKSCSAAVVVRVRGNRTSPSGVDSPIRSDMRIGSDSR